MNVASASWVDHCWKVTFLRVNASHGSSIAGMCFAECERYGTTLHAIPTAAYSRA